MSIIYTGWTKYTYGWWRRVGNTMEVKCCHDKPVMPKGFRPKKEPVFIDPSSDWIKFRFTVEIDGWALVVRALQPVDVWKADPDIYPVCKHDKFKFNCKECY